VAVADAGQILPAAPPPVIPASNAGSELAAPADDSAAAWLPPQPTPVQANIVYAFAVQRVEASEYLIAGCVANLGARPESNLDLMFDLRAPAASIMALRASWDSLEINARHASVLIDSLAPGQMRQAEIRVRSDVPIANHHFRVWAPQGRLLEGRVQLACVPRGVTGAVLAPEQALFMLDGELISVGAARMELQRQGVPVQLNAPAVRGPVMVAGAPMFQIASVASLLAATMVLVGLLGVAAMLRSTLLR
jgi:hypothetical protein